MPVLDQLGCVAFQGNPAGFHHVCPMGNLQCDLGVLLVEEDGRSLVADVNQNLKDHLDDFRAARYIFVAFGMRLSYAEFSF